MKEVTLTPMEQASYNAAAFTANIFLAGAVYNQIRALHAEEQDLSDASGGAPPLNMVITLGIQWNELAMAAVGDA
jgi:hypothetical protein